MQVVTSLDDGARPPVDPEALSASAEDAARLLRAMAHGPRLRILCMLLDGECSSGEIARSIGIKEPAASQQLALLRAERLVESRRDGQRVVYRIAHPTVRHILLALYEAFCPARPDAD